MCHIIKKNVQREFEKMLSTYSKKCSKAFISKYINNLLKNMYKNILVVYKMYDVYERNVEIQIYI